MCRIPSKSPTSPWRYASAPVLCTHDASTRFSTDLLKSRNDLRILLAIPISRVHPLRVYHLMRYPDKQMWALYGGVMLMFHVTQQVQACLT